MHGKGAGLVRPVANTGAMQRHLEEISLHVARGSHGVVLMDPAGWHQTGRLDVPKNLTIILLPPRSPRTQPSSDAWNNIIDMPDTIRSIGWRDWAYMGQ
jgi:hypothetical protein